MTGLFLIALAAAFNSGALMLVRFAERGIQWSAPVLSISVTSAGWLACSLLAYALAFVLTIRILATHYFGVAVPIFIGLQFAFSLLAARWVFHEPVEWSQLAGTIFILTGVALVAWKK
jgi:multidrug transporter EmrE-like cation transporter